MPAQSVDPRIDEEWQHEPVEGTAHDHAGEERQDELDPAHRSPAELTARTYPVGGTGSRCGSDQRRADVYSSARIGAAAALTLVLVVLLVLDVAVPDYDISPGILLPLLGVICALLGLEASAFWRNVR